MNRVEKIQWLKGVRDGNIDPKESALYMEDKKKMYEKMSGSELMRLLRNYRLCDDPEGWPPEEKQFFSEVMEDVKHRSKVEHHTDFRNGLYKIDYCDNKRPSIFHYEDSCLKIENEFMRLSITSLESDGIDCLRLTKWELPDIIMPSKYYEINSLEKPIDLERNLKLLLDDLILRSGIKKAFEGGEDVFYITYDHLSYPVLRKFRDHVNIYSLHKKYSINQ
jgi:hypothetical protein